MASSNDANDAYTQGVIDTVALINENEGLNLSERDVINALAIQRLFDNLTEGE
jgi:hypothetical protein